MIICGVETVALSTVEESGNTVVYSGSGGYLGKEKCNSLVTVVNHIFSLKYEMTKLTVFADAGTFQD
jgi:hypothetical protein